MLYTKYRSQTFGELVGQDVITKTLSNAIAEGRVGHAYVFSGPRGTGKTSAARIFAKAVNCENSKKSGEPCNKCNSCLQITEGRAVDVIEIDAASHTSVDDIRDLIEKVSFSPVSFRKKVYIIDEVHMLSKSAFNALLKTLEEPPAHALFILATTEIHKIPVTILSRCQRFDFKLGSDEEIADVLKSIVKSEKIKIEEDALKYVIDIAQGSYRDAISTMERVLSKSEITSDKIITAEEVRMFLGIPDDAKFELLLEFINDGKTQEALDLINAIVESGKDIKFFSSYFLGFLRKSLIYSLQLEPNLSGGLFRVLKEFIEADKNLSSSPVIQLPLEIAVIKLTTELGQQMNVSSSRIGTPTQKKNEEAPSVKSVKKTSARTTDVIEEKPSDSKLKKSQQEDVVENIDDDSAHTEACGIEEITARWQEFILAAKPFNGHLYAFISKSSVSDFDKSGALMLTVPYDFYKERIEDSKSQKILSKVGEDIFGVKLRIKCKVGKIPEALTSETGEKEDVVDDALDVFGEDVV